MREHFLEWFKKSMIWWLHCLLLSISKIWFRTIHNFRFDDWQLTCWQRDLSRILSYFFTFVYQSRWVFWKEWFRRERRRIVAIATNISDFKNLILHSTTYFTFILNVQSNQTVISEDVFDTIQFFMRRKF